MVAVCCGSVDVDVVAMLERRGILQWLTPHLLARYPKQIVLLYVVRAMFGNGCRKDGTNDHFQECRHDSAWRHDTLRAVCCGMRCREGVALSQRREGGRNKFRAHTVPYSEAVFHMWAKQPVK